MRRSAPFLHLSIVATGSPAEGAEPEPQEPQEQERNRRAACDLALGQCLVTLLTVQRHGVLRPKSQPREGAEVPTEPMEPVSGLGKGKSFRQWRGLRVLGVAKDNFDSPVLGQIVGRSFNQGTWPG